MSASEVEGRSARLSVVSEPSPEGLLGRRSEVEVLGRFVARARGGRSQAVVVRGDAGVGKTALVDEVLGRAPGCRVARAVGVASEAALAFAGLHQLCAPFLGRLERLPRPQREALRTAFGLRDGAAPDRFLVSLAVLGLLASVAEEQPLIAVLDDAQWLDPASAQALAFVARHLVTEAIAMVFVVRGPADREELTGLAELCVRGLADRDARAVLRTVVTGPLDERVRDRIVAEARGNPLALLELPRRLTPAELAGGFGLLDSPALAGRREERLRRGLAALPGATRTLLLVAATEPVLDPVVVWRAAGLLGIGADAAAPAAGAGLIDPGGQLRFRHPLTRSAVYRAASPQQRQTVHRALADAVDAAVDPDRRAWHRGHATAGLDEEVAAALEDAADGARVRGGLAAAAAFRQLAAELTPDPSRRARRALAAARAKHLVGAGDAALQLVAMAMAGPLDARQRARADLLRAQLAGDSDRADDVPPRLLAAAGRFGRLDPGLARETYRDALSAALTAGRLASGGGLPQVAAAVRPAPPARSTAMARLLAGAGALIADGYPTGAPLVRQALVELRARGIADDEDLRWLALAAPMAHAVWDDESGFVLSAALVAQARESGALTVLPIGLASGAVLQAVAGDLAQARLMAADAQAIGAATGRRLAPYGALVVAAWAGDEAGLARLLEASTDELIARGEGQWLTAVDWASSVLYNGLGQYQKALLAAERAADVHAEPGWSSWALAEGVEAAVRSGAPERAAAAVERLAEIARASGSDWALGVAARSRALVGGAKDVEGLYREAIGRLGGTRLRAEVGRAHLLYGEWLRRAGRRVDARGQLRTADEMLAGMGVGAFAQRARRELLATGETVRKRTDEARDELTPQELQIARLARDGHTNPQIGAQLFISSRTVEWHLRKVFSKLGISSRKELDRALPERGSASVAA